MNKLLFAVADFLSKPPGFYITLAAMIVCTALVPLGRATETRPRCTPSA